MKKLKSFDVFTPEMVYEMKHYSMKNAVKAQEKSLTRLMSEHWPNCKLVTTVISKKNVTVHIVRKGKPCTGVRIIQL